MAEDAHGGVDGHPFEAIDPKLTVFALANGMDLVKEDGSRRLSWFTEGRERGLQIGPGQAGYFSVTALAWQTRSPEDTASSPIASDVAVDELMATLERGIEDANAL